MIQHCSSVSFRQDDQRSVSVLIEILILEALEARAKNLGN
jgi:hypothetical protein